MALTDKSRFFSAFAAAVGGVLNVGPAFADDTLTPGAMNATVDPSQRHIVSLKNVDIAILIEDVSAITGYTFVVHPSVSGDVTVVSQTPLTTREVFQVFLSTLRVQGYAAVPGANGVFKIVPEQSATAEAALVNPAVAGDQIETAVFKFDNMNAVEAARMIKPVTNPQGQVVASQASNAVIVVDYAANISRVRQLAGQLDQDRSSIVTLPLNNAGAEEMARTVNGLASGGDQAFGLDVNAIAVESSNSLIIRGNVEDVTRVTQIVEDLDRANQPSEDSLKVVSLSFADAAELAPVIDGIGQRMSGVQGEGAGGPPPPSVLVDVATNSLVISAEPQMMSELERVIRELDVRRTQVLVEAIIVELSNDAVRELGVQFALGGDDDSTVPFASTNFNSATPNVLALAGAVSPLDAVFGSPDDTTSATEGLGELAVQSLLNSPGALLGVAGEIGDDGVFGVILNAVQDDDASRVLSTPSVVALDNQTATFTSGQEIPITTGEALGSANVNPFRTVERKDVGIQLDILPQVNDDQTIRLQIRQENSAIVGPVTAASSDLITNKRSIETTVLAEDGDLIILGGLIEETEIDDIEKVPLLGDIPLLGRLFRNETTTRRRTSLMVFMRPTIVRDAAEFSEVTQDRFDFIVGEQRLLNPDGFSSLEALLERFDNDDNQEAEQ
ncbi:MAG: type II secretion system secretin GspD [Pseudomonadota bacterium]